MNTALSIAWLLFAALALPACDRSKEQPRLDVASGQDRRTPGEPVPHNPKTRTGVNPEEGEAGGAEFYSFLSREQTERLSTVCMHGNDSPSNPELHKLAPRALGCPGSHGRKARCLQFGRIPDKTSGQSDKTPPLQAICPGCRTL